MLAARDESEAGVIDDFKVYEHNGRYWFTLDGSAFGLMRDMIDSGIKQALQTMEHDAGCPLRLVSTSTAFAPATAYRHSATMITVVAEKADTA